MKKCVIIDEPLLTPRCPLPDGACVWKHRKTGMCMYSSEYDNNPPSAQRIAKLVGEKTPSPTVVARVTEKIKTSFINTAGVLK